MRLHVVSILFFFLMLAGCKSSTKPDPEPKARTVVVQTNLVNGRSGKAMARPSESLSGRVVSVNDQLRFVIVDFPNQKLPRLEQKLSVYRSDLKVAEIKISGPYRGTTVAADITAGDARYGDQVRDER